MLFALTTTAKDVLSPDDSDRMITFSAGKFAASATSVYIQPVNTKKPWIILNAAGKSDTTMLIPHGTQLEGYTDAGTADLAVLITGFLKPI
jgi:hypothetical protein